MQSWLRKRVPKTCWIVCNALAFVFLLRFSFNASPRLQPSASRASPLRSISFNSMKDLSISISTTVDGLSVAQVPGGFTGPLFDHSSVHGAHPTE